MIEDEPSEEKVLGENDQDVEDLEISLGKLRESKLFLQFQHQANCSKISALDQKKEYFEFHSFLTMKSFFGLSLEYRSLKMLALQDSLRIDSKQKFRRIYEKLLSSLEKALAKLKIVEKFTFLPGENIDEKIDENKLREVRRNCLENEFRLKFLENKKAFEKDKIRELKSFLRKCLKTPGSDQEIDRILEKKFQNLLIKNEMRKYEDFSSFLGDLDGIIEENKKEIESEYSKFLESQEKGKEQGVEALNESYNDFFKLMSSFEISKQNFISALKKDIQTSKFKFSFQQKTETEKLISHLSQLNLVLNEVNRNEDSFNVFIANIGKLKELSISYSKEIKNLQENFEKMKNLKEEIKSKKKVLKKSLEGKLNCELLAEELNQKKQISLIISFQKQISLFTRKIDYDEGGYGEGGYDQDEFEVLEKVAAELKVLNEGEIALKDLKISDLRMKIEEDNGMRIKMEEKLETRSERKILIKKKECLKIWRDGAWKELLEKKEELFRKIKEVSEESRENEEKIIGIKKLLKTLKEKIKRENAEISRFEKKIQRLVRDGGKIKEKLHEIEKKEDKILKNIAENKIKDV